MGVFVGGDGGGGNDGELEEEEEEEEFLRDMRMRWGGILWFGD